MGCSARVFRYKFWKGVDIVFRLEDEDVEVEFKGPSAPFVNYALKSNLIKHFKYYKRVKVLAAKDGYLVYTLYYPPLPSKPYAKMLKTVARTILTRKFVPRAVTVAVTYACQCRCRHCSAGVYTDTARALRRKELSTDELKRLIDDCIRLGAVNITFTGGEPLLHPHIYELIGYVNKEEAVTQLFTNGLLLTKENVRKLKEAGLYSLEVSLDTPSPEEHDDFRGVEGVFKSAIQGIEYALEEGLLVGISTYATREGIKDGKIEKLFDLARELGVHEVSVFDPVPTGRLLKTEDVLLTDEERLELIKIQRRYNLMEGPPRISTQSFQCSPIAFHALGCFSGTNQAYVTAFGDVTPCDFTPLSFGNVRDEPFEAIWRRIRKHPAYSNRTMRCKMQNVLFREKYINRIPEEANLPFPIGSIQDEDSEQRNEATSSLKALMSLNRLKMLDYSYPILFSRLPTKEGLEKCMDTDSKSLNRDLEILINARLVRTEHFLNKTYLFPAISNFSDWVRLNLIHFLLKLAPSWQAAKSVGRPETDLDEGIFDFLW